MSAAAILFLLSFILTGVYRLLALRSGWLDHPNQRSSHIHITPRGAGVVFGVLILGLAFALLEREVLRNALIAGVAVISVGWWDDIRGLATRFRFYVYTLASIIAVYALNFVFLTPVSFVIAAIAAIGLLWLINLYNFMDGINGIAGSEAIFVLLAVLWLSGNIANGNEMALFIWAACAAIGGFLLWNFPIGRVFMGDAGSAFLGFLLGVLALSSTQWGGPKLATWFILLGVFIVDTSFTLIVRAISGQRWYQAHRLHGYQKLNHKLGSHAFTLTVVMAVNLGWLLPWAWLVESDRIAASPGTLCAYFPLVVACHALKAGRAIEGTV
jgi:Fuc2NAc and GlcNAc transferase